MLRSRRKLVFRIQSKLLMSEHFAASVFNLLVCLQPKDLSCCRFEFRYQSAESLDFFTRNQNLHFTAMYNTVAVRFLLQRERLFQKPL